MAPSTSKLLPFHDPRVQLKSAHLNGYTYGYIYSPRSPTAPNRGTIILIHGFPDLSFGWRYQIPFLSSLGLDVIAPDCMGYGRTDSPRNTLADYTYLRISTDIATLCQQLNLTSIILGGHDWGGAIVYRIAQYHPQLVRALFSICTPYFPPNPKHESLAQLVSTRLPNFGYQLHFISGEIEDAVKSRREIRQFLSNLYGQRTPDRKAAFSAEKGVDLEAQTQITQTPKFLNTDELDFYVQEYSRHGIRGPLNWYRTRELNYLDELEHFFGSGSKTDKPKTTQIQQECLFVYATRDQALPAFMSEKMGEKIPKLTRREIEASHWVLWEKPDQINGMIGKWLEEKVFERQKGKSKL